MRDVAPPAFLPDGSLNPAWTAWTFGVVSSMQQSSGSGVELGPSGMQFADPEPESHWVRITAVNSGVTPPRHDAEEVWRDPNAATSFDYDPRPGGLVLSDADGSAAIEASGQAAAVDDVVQVRRDGGGNWVFSLGGGGIDGNKEYVFTGTVGQVLTYLGSAVATAFVTSQQFIVYCILLRTGQSIPAGTTVHWAWSKNLGRYEVIAASCPDEATAT